MLAAPDIKRRIIGFIVAPLAPSLAIALIFDWNFALQYLVAFGYPAVVVTGVPAHLILRRLGWSNGFVYILAGFIAGIVFEYFYAIGMASLDFGQPEPLLARWREAVGTLIHGPELTAIIGGCGAFAALVFYLIAEPVKRPEK